MVKVSFPNIDVVTNDPWSLRMIRKWPLSKSLSRSSPSVATSDPIISNASSTTSLSTPMSSSGQKRFHRYFTQASAEEYVIKFYSCALVADILLQGHLYITPNYFGFYSNVFGYVTRILIPTSSVVEIRKQKTLKIIPNAIAVATNKDSYVFCSLFSRDSTFELMKQVWKDYNHRSSIVDSSLTSKNQFKNPEIRIINDSEASYEEDNSSGCGNEDHVATPESSCTSTEESSASVPEPFVETKTTSRETSSKSLVCNLKSQIIIAILVVLLAMLYFSAAVLMIRIDRLQAKYINHSLDSSHNENQIRNHLS